MEKAYDIKEFVKLVKDEGLELTEEAAKVLNKVTFKWLKLSAEISKTPLDNVLVPFYPLVEAKIEEAADKINPVG
jgi:hypothetical protein